MAKSKQVKGWRRILSKDSSPLLSLHETMPVSFNTHTCRHCYKHCNNLCKSCRGVFYCGKECQSLDWPIHKHYCKEIQKGWTKWQENETRHIAMREKAEKKEKGSKSVKTIIIMSLIAMSH